LPSATGGEKIATGIVRTLKNEEKLERNGASRARNAKDDSSRRAGPIPTWKTHVVTDVHEGRPHGALVP
jgi:hypothetical protein